MSRRSSADDPFARLEIAATSSEAEVMAAYRSLARRSHPDFGGAGTDMDALRSAKDEALAIVRARGRPRRSTSSLFEGIVDSMVAEGPGRNVGKGAYFGADIDAFVPVPGVILKAGGIVAFERRCDCPRCCPGAADAVCRVCNGVGMKTMTHGAVSMDVRCKVCGGSGRVTSDKAACITPGRAPVLVEVPPGSELGQILTIRGQGMPGPQGRGDLFAHLVAKPEAEPRPSARKVEPHGEMSRLRFKLEVDLYEAACGAVVRADVPDVGFVDVRLAPGTQSGKVFRCTVDGREVEIAVRVRIPDGSQEPFRAIFEQMRRLRQ